MKYFRNFLFHSMHDDWYICESDQRSSKLRTVRQKIKIVLDFYNGDPDVLDRCTFLLYPIPPSMSKLKNCQGAIGPVSLNTINGQAPPEPPPLVPPKPSVPVLPACLPTCLVIKPAANSTSPTPRRESR